MKLNALILIGLGLTLVGSQVLAEEMAQQGSMDKMKADMPQKMGEMKDEMTDEMAGEMTESMPEMAVAPAEGTLPAATAQIAMVNNKACPISGENTDSTEAVQVEYKGKMYKLCCAMCVKDFNKDPDKYVKAIEDRMAKEAASASEAVSEPTAAAMDMGDHAMGMTKEAVPAVKAK